MNKTLIEELDRLNDRFPFTVFELETLDGRRIRLTRRFHKLWGDDEQKDGDIKIENGVIAFLRYDDLQDIIYFVPPWKRPLSWLYERPQWLAIPIVCVMWGVMIGIGIETCSSHRAPVEHKP